MSSAAAAKATPPEEEEYNLATVKEIVAVKPELYKLLADGKIRGFILKLGLAAGLLGSIFTPFLTGLGQIQPYGAVVTLLLWLVIAVVDYGANFPGYFLYKARARLHAFAQSLGLKLILTMVVVLVVAAILGAPLLARLFTVTREVADVAITYVEKKADKALKKAPPKPSVPALSAKSEAARCKAQKDLKDTSPTYCDANRGPGLSDNSQKEICKPCP